MIKDLDYKVANKLKEMRDKSGLTLKDIASKLDVSIQQVNRYEHCECNINIVTLQKFCEIYRIEINDLFNDIKNDEINQHNTSPNKTVIIISNEMNDCSMINNQLHEFDRKLNIQLLYSDHDIIKYCTELSHSPSLIIFDKNKIVDNDYINLKYLRNNKHCKNVPIIIITNDQEQPTIDRIYMQNINSVIIKSCMDSEFSNQLHEIIHYWLNLTSLPKTMIQT
jgi:transcriptional regulator with XRE-family HTH domain